MSANPGRLPYTDFCSPLLWCVLWLCEQKDMRSDMICVDWQVDMAQARKTLGSKPISGNVDPTILLGPQEGIVRAVDECIAKAGGHGHILNLGHGVIKETPEEAVRLFVDTAKSIRLGDKKPAASSNTVMSAPLLAGVGA